MEHFQGQYMKTLRHTFIISVLLLLLPAAQAQNIDNVKQGFSMKLWMDNLGVFGIQAYPGTIPADSLGCEYPAGTNIEHIFGGGIWVGGYIDTSVSGTGTPLKRVTTGYEGWSGPLNETYPGNDPADTVWQYSRRDSVKPPGWDAYWEGVVPFNPISDKDLYMKYNDYDEVVSGHLPLGLKFFQSSYAWQDPYADAIIVVEYRILNVGDLRTGRAAKQIDSAYIGWFFEADVGPINATNYFQRNFTAYIKESFTAYIHNPIDAGATPIGATLLWPQDTLLDYTFAWYPGPESPTPDGVRYDVLSSGVIEPDEYPAVSDTRFLFAFGPFTIKPASDPTADTLRIAIGIISGFSRTIDHRLVLQNNAARAKDIYLNRGIRLPPTPPSPPLRVSVGFRSVMLDWKWRIGDDSVYAGHDDPRIYGRNNPEANWDSTNQVARRYPTRYQAPHPPGHDPTTDTTIGGRNFSAYRVWRSENPQAPDPSFTLLAQYDVAEDSFEYNSGLKFSFVDSNLVRGKTYVYSVTSISIPSLAYQTVPKPPPDSGNTVVEVPVEPLESSKQVNATRIDLPFSVSSELGKVSVVPNPYRTDRDYTLESGGYEGLFSQWDETKRVVKFINLPEVCTIRIFSLSGDLIRTINHDGRSTTGISRGDVSVPLVSESNRAMASGIYVFTVESDLGTQTGKFVIIR
jgi:hypothetical protein